EHPNLTPSKLESPPMRRIHERMEFAHERPAGDRHIDQGRTLANRTIRSGPYGSRTHIRFWSAPDNIRRQGPAARRLCHAGSAGSRQCIRDRPRWRIDAGPHSQGDRLRCRPRALTAIQRGIRGGLWCSSTDAIHGDRATASGRLSRRDRSHRSAMSGRSPMSLTSEKKGKEELALPTSCPELNFASITELSEAIRTRKISASELLELTIARIETLDQRFNAVVVRDFDRAREAAKAADAALARNEQRPLLGIPVTLKEAFNVAGLPTTFGYPQFRNFMPDEDALVVTRLREAGAVIIGKTNVPMGLRDFQSYTDIYGTRKSPWDANRSPGGSSGGSAAALAAGFGPLSIGSDIGGSVRMPAHFCGVFAHKPSLGLVPLRGYSLPPAPPVPASGDLAVAGPMARYASDLALALGLIAGPDDARDGIGYRLALA